MNLKKIFDDILQVATEIEYNTLAYRHKALVLAGKKANPADLLTGIAAIFDLEITNSITPSKQKLESALDDLKRIAREYGIEQLKRPIKDLSAFLKN